MVRFLDLDILHFPPLLERALVPFLPPFITSIHFYGINPLSCPLVVTPHFFPSFFSVDPHTHICVAILFDFLSSLFNVFELVIILSQLFLYHFRQTSSLRRFELYSSGPPLYSPNPVTLSPFPLPPLEPEL